MRNALWPTCLVWLAVAGVLTSGCGPTYRREQIVSAIQDICAREYRFDLTARVTGDTLAVHIHHPDLLESVDGHVELQEEANKVLGDVIEAIHRVVLSSDAPYRFYMIVASDPQVPNVALTLVRYFDDVKRANANMLTPTEFYHRTILDLHFVATPTLTLEQVAATDIRLEQFLSWQLSKRIQTKLIESMSRRGELPAPESIRCTGDYQNGEFIFALSLEQKDGTGIQELLQDAASVVAQVLTDYRFDRYDTIRLTHPPSGQSLMLPKTRLQLLK
jgi:hypothetical protein